VIVIRILSAKYIDVAVVSTLFIAVVVVEERAGYGVGVTSKPSCAGGAILKL
jgi:energy-converting hydrogenase Eha subunit C